MAKICFVVGHGKSKSGGYDPGACADGYEEFKIAREIAKHAAEYYNKHYNEQADLMNYSGDVYLTDRIKKVNAADYDFIAEIHLNAGKGTGTETFYSSGNSTGKKYAQEICRSISAHLGIRNRGAKTKLNKNGKDYFAIIRDTNPCAVLIETVFIDRPSDLSNVKYETGQIVCGQAIAKAVASVRGAEKKTASTEKAETVNDGSFLVRVIDPALNIRRGAGSLHRKVGVITDEGTYTIVETNKSGTWGKLKSGAGWICIKPKYVERI